MKTEIAPLDKTWPHVLPGLNAMHEQSDVDWSVSEVYDALESGDALLFTDPEAPGSFAIVKLRPYPYNWNDLELFVWMAFCREGDAVQRYLPQFEAAARAGGARWMRFMSARPAMPKLANGVGFRVHNIEYVKEL